MKCTHRSVFEVDLVSEEDEGEALGRARTCLNEELIPPAVQRFECVGDRDVIDENATISSAIERNA